MLDDLAKEILRTDIMVVNSATGNLDEGWDRQVLVDLLQERRKGRFLNPKTFKVRVEDVLIDAARKFALEG